MDPARDAVSAESRHAPSGGREWHEAHRLDAVFPGARMAVSLQISFHPGRGHGEFHAVMTRLGEDPIAVVEFDVPIPERGWEIRASGLWADHVCETPMDHWSYGLEAFGLSVDHPDELMGAGLGDRVPLGWELEFEARAAAQPSPEATRYGQVGQVHGLVLEKGVTTEVDGYGVRSHWWGTEPPGHVELGSPGDGPPTIVVPAVGGRWEMFVAESGTRASFLA